MALTPEKIEEYISLERQEGTRIALLSSFERYFKFMFYAVNESPVLFQPFHKIMCSKLEGMAKQTNTKRNLCLNVPVGAGKSLLVEYFISWCYARNISNAFVYTSYNSDLILKLSQETKEICNHPTWKELFKGTLRQDNKSKAQWSFEGAVNRTGLNAKAMGGGITGLDCFGYDEIVATSKGDMKIGDIVENKIDVSILSCDTNSGNISFMPIDNYIKNRDSTMGVLELSDGSKIECTPCHKFWTNNKGYVKASELSSDDILPSNPFDSVNTTIKFRTESGASIGSIADFVNIGRGKDDFVSRWRNECRDADTFGYVSPVFPPLDGCDMPIGDIVNYSDIMGSSCTVLSNFNNGGFIKLKYVVRVSPRAWASSVLDCIGIVFRPSSVCNIFDSIVKLITIKVSNIHTYRLNSDKSPSYSPMYRNISSNTSLTQGNGFISSCGEVLGKLNTLVRLVPSLLSDSSCFTPNPTTGCYTIKPLIVRDRRPVCYTATHVDSSYCLTVRGNHNMFIGEGKVLASNCGNPNIIGFSGALIIDDPMDAVAGMRYPRTREECISFYDDKLTTRRRTPTTPTILIMQRLHKGDLTGWLIDTEKEDWDIVTIPAIDEKGESFWPARYPVEELEKIKNINPYKYQAQYQQNPINAGGEVIKPEWFQYYEGVPDRIDRLFITGDTAQKVKEHNDYTVFMAWAVADRKLYLLDMRRGKWEAPELLTVAKAFYKLHSNLKTRHCQGFYIEDKASGTGLIQQLKHEGHIPVIGIQRNTDKLTRVEDGITFIFQGDVLLPQDQDYGQNGAILSECASFARDDSHTHDDIVDTLMDGIKIGLSKTSTSILDVL